MAARTVSRGRRVNGIRRTDLLAVLALGLAFAIPIQSVGWNQTTHYALVRALAHGTARIDAYQATTGDKALYRGHWYADKAPGLALWELPAYQALRAVGATSESPVRVGGLPNDRTIWLLGLWGTVLPAIVLLLMVRSVANRLEPGFGTIAAVTIGAASLLLPFSTLMFAHVFTAALVFAAFTILFTEFARSSPARATAVGGAGLFAGFAVTTEYASLLVSLVLGLYALLGGRARDRSSRDLLVRAGAYASGMAAGILPLLLYNRWAFGSFTHLAYSDVPVQQRGFFGIGAPDPTVLFQLLLSYRGLVTLAPVLVMGGIGVVMIYRRGWRTEAITIAGIGVVLLLYNAGYWLPFGGKSPGPRFLLMWLPFLGVGLAPAWRRLPGPTLALGAAAAVAALIPTMTEPMIPGDAETGVWLDRLGAGRFQATVSTLLGAGDGWVAWAPVFAALIVTAILVVRATPTVKFSAPQLYAGLVAASCWALFAATGPAILGIDPRGTHPTITLALIGVTAAILAAGAVVLAQAQVSSPPRERRVASPS